MQGQTQSSLAIWTAFNNMTTAAFRVLQWVLKIAWTRVETDVNYAIVGTSIVGGTSIIQGQISAITSLDNFYYFQETEHLIRFEYDRSVYEPLSGISKAIGDLLIENVDGRFTPNQNATIGTSILPNRPLQMFLGFVVQSINKTVQIFEGVTRQPRLNYLDRTVSIQCIDTVAFLDEVVLDASYYENQTADEIIEDILLEAGLTSSQYSLEQGINTISFIAFDNSITAGNRIKILCESEEGFFYQDEVGILRFENRLHFNSSPYNNSVWDLGLDDIVYWEEEEPSPIINRIIVRGNERVLGTTQDIWSALNEETIALGTTRTIWADLDNPAIAITAPVATTDYLAFSATGGGGSNLTSSVTVVATNYITKVKLVITNSSGSTAFLNLLKIRGTPYLVSNSFETDESDTTSISKYEEQLLEIENEAITDEDFGIYLSRVLLLKYANPAKRIKVTVQGVPQLQLRDRVTLQDPELLTYSHFRVVRIQGELAEGLFSQILTLREITDEESSGNAIVGTTTVGSTSEVVGLS